MIRSSHVIPLAASLLGLLSATAAPGATPTVQQALGLEPVQPHVEYEKPTGAAVKDCALQPISGSGQTGWQLVDGEEKPLRRFLDSNRDKKIDQWCYYLRGIEVYRDIDTDFNGKADEYRWLGTAGSRWGLDRDQDGTVDHWKMISPEEVTAEVVSAIRSGDASRFETILLSTDELTRLGLGRDMATQLKKRIQTAKSGFQKYVSQQQTIQSKSRWLHFGATRPGVIPQGTDGSTQDLLIYDNVAAVVEHDGQHSQLIVGTLVNVGRGWRVIDLPQTESSAGFFYTSLNATSADQADSGLGLDQRMQELLGKLEEIDEKLSSANRAGVPGLNAERAGVLEQLAEQAATRKERDGWMRQFADSVSASVQAGDFPEGLRQLKSVLLKLDRERAANDLQAYVKFRYLTAEYGQKLQEKDADFAKIQETWLKNLRQFVKDHPGVPDAAEAMLQLAIAQEFAGKEKDASAWYGRIIKEFSSTDLAAKATGAKRRLESVGKSMSLRGKTLDGKSIDLSRLRGRTVLIHYWATWCEPCKRDIKTIRQLQAKLPSSKFAAIGVNLDADRQTVSEFLRANRIPWPQLYEPGGLDSRLANEMGVLTLPTMILVDKTGRVVRRNIDAGELDKELNKMVK